MSKEVRFVQTRERPNHHVSAEDRAERTRELLGQLETELTTLTDSDAWKRYLAMQGRLHKYSFGNCLLIGMQCPDATHVAGYQTWRQLGRQVRKGEKGIRIMVPYVFRKSAEPTAGADADQEEADNSYVRFGVGHIFDISQTEGNECVVEWGEARGDLHAAGLGLSKLEAYAQSLGYTVERADEPGTQRGHCDFKARRIVLDSVLDVVGQTATLAHELAHALLHDGITDYQARRGHYEVEAESVAYVVLTGLGLDASACALPYLAHWSGGDPKQLRELGERVHKASAQLLAVADALADNDRETVAAA
jgi:antirestriction factor ArdC-like protein/uncharacterized protein DUF6782